MYFIIKYLDRILKCYCNKTRISSTPKNRYWLIFLVRKIIRVDLG